MLLFYRLWLGVGILVVVALATGTRLRRRDLLAVVPGGLLLCADMAFFFSAVKLTSVADASIIGALQPALVLLVAGPFFAERIGRSDVAFTLVAIAGVSLVVVGSGPVGGRHLSGDLLAVASLFCWSGYFLVSKRARRGVGAVEYTLGVTLVAALALTPVVLLGGQSLSIRSGADWWWIVLLAVIPGTGHLLMNWAHRSVDVSLSSLIGSSNPIFAAAVAWFALDQGLDATQILGGMVGLVAICLVAARRRVEVSAPVEPAT